MCVRIYLFIYVNSNAYNKNKQELTQIIPLFSVYISVTRNTLHVSGQARHLYLIRHGNCGVIFCIVISYRYMEVMISTIEKHTKQQFDDTIQTRLYETRQFVRYNVYY